MHPEKYLRSMIGYCTVADTSLVAMAMVQGRQREVVNIGLGVRLIAPEPADAPAHAYLESLSHKVGPLPASSARRPADLSPFLRPTRS
jgi:4'-phosphopantetheinyl transferase